MARCPSFVSDLLYLVHVPTVSAFLPLGHNLLTLRPHRPFPFVVVPKLYQVSQQLDAADKTTVESKISETIAWLDANQTAEKEEFEEKQKELEAVCNPIIQKMAAAGGGGMPGGVPGGMPDMGGGGTGPVPEAEADAGPKIEEID